MEVLIYVGLGADPNLPLTCCVVLGSFINLSISSSSNGLVGCLRGPRVGAWHRGFIVGQDLPQIP